MKPAVYEGNEPYIFVSYAHRDSDAVFQVLYELQKRGYRLWYDDGIAPGSEWPEDIAQHLDAAAMVIAFITPSSMASQNCRREISFSLAREKPFVSILLEPTDVPLGMQMQLFAQQSIVRYNFDSYDGFIKKVLSCPGLAPCQNGSTTPPATIHKGASSSSPAAKPGFSNNPAKQPRRTATIVGIAAAVLVAVVAIAVALGNTGGSDKEGEDSAIIPIESGTETTHAAVYVDRLVPYYSTGFYQVAQDLDKVEADSETVPEAFSLVSFIKTNATGSVMVESSACEIESLTTVEEPVLTIEPAIVGDTLYIYGLNNGWGESEPEDLGIVIYNGPGSNYELSDFAKTLYDADAIAYGPGDVRLVQSYSLDAEAFKKWGRFDERYGDWSIMFDPAGSMQVRHGYAIYYSEDRGFTVDIIGRGSAPQGSVELFAVLDVDKGPGTLMFSSAESQPLIDEVCRISMTIAPTKTCELTCRGVFSVDEQSCESEPHSVKVEVPVFNKKAFIVNVIAPHNNYGAPMILELAKNPDASLAEIEMVTSRYRYDPEWILESRKSS